MNNAIYGLGVIGALIYYFQHSTGASQLMVGVVKAVFWPGFIVYELIEFLKM